MINLIADNFYYLFIAVIVLNLFQRKYRERGQDKRIASLFISIMVFIVYFGAITIRAKNLPEIWILLPLAVDISLFYALKKRILVFRKSCTRCGKNLSAAELFCLDSNLCRECSGENEPGDKKE